MWLIFLFVSFGEREVRFHWAYRFHFVPSLTAYDVSSSTKRFACLERLLNFIVVHVEFCKQFFFFSFVCCLVFSSFFDEFRFVCVLSVEIDEENVGWNLINFDRFFACIFAFFAFRFFINVFSFEFCTKKWCNEDSDEIKMATIIHLDFGRLV